MELKGHWSWRNSNHDKCSLIKKKDERTGSKNSELSKDERDSKGGRSLKTRREEENIMPLGGGISLSAGGGGGRSVPGIARGGME